MSRVDYVAVKLYDCARCEKKFFINACTIKIGSKDYRICQKCVKTIEKIVKNEIEIAKREKPYVFQIVKIIDHREEVDKIYRVPQKSIEKIERLLTKRLRK